MRRMTLGLAAAAVIAGSVGFGGAARATTLTGSIGLSDSTDSLQIGGITISNISCQSSAFPNSCTGGEIAALAGSPAGFVIQSATSGSSLIVNTSNTSNADITVSFQLVSTPAVSTIGLGVGNGTGTVNVSENVVDYTSGASLAHYPTNALNSSSTLTLSSSDTNIYITKDISLNPTSSIDSVTQTFPGISGPSLVPEPATIGLFAFGMVLLGLARRRLV